MPVLQCLSVAVQRGNAISIQGSVGGDPDSDFFGVLYHYRILMHHTSIIKHAITLQAHHHIIIHCSVSLLFQCALLFLVYRKEQDTTKADKRHITCLFVESNAILPSMPSPHFTSVFFTPY